MKKTRPLEAYENPDYPQLDLTCGRRQFLGRAVLGALAAGVGGRLLAACSSTGSIVGDAASDGTTTPDVPRDSTSDAPADTPRTLLTVRLPESGFTGTYITYADFITWDEDCYLSHAVVLTTYNASLAEFMRSHEAEALGVVAEALDDNHCMTVLDDSSLSDLESLARLALEEWYTGRFGPTADLVESLDILVDLCECYGPMPGGMALPGYGG